MHVLEPPCPICGSVSVRRSRWRTGDLAALLRLMGPLRCQDCANRFHAPLFGMELPEDAASEPNDVSAETPSPPQAFDVAESDLVIRLRRPNRVLRFLLLTLCDPSDSRLE